MPTTYNMTSGEKLQDAVNVVLANLGEAPVNTIVGTTTTLPQQVSLALNTIEEVSNDVQSKGWWFNQTSNGTSSGTYSVTQNIKIHPSNDGNDWSGDIPHEARRYITIRAARIAQTRLIGSEELQKFSYNEELVSLAVLQQAHVRNSNGVLDFNDFPSELKGLGVDEIMFLQGNVEEKIGTLRLGGELANTAKTKAETALIADQEELVAKQTLTEVKNALKVVAETSLINDQEALVTKQALTEVQNALKVIAETSLINDQEALVIKQALTEVAKATDIGADTTIKGKQGLLIDNQAATELKTALKLVADTTLVGKQGSLVDAQATDVAADTTLKGKQGALVDAQATTEASQQTVLGAQATNLGADSTLKGAQATTEGSQQTALGAQATKSTAEGTLATNQAALVTSQKTQLDAQTAIEATAEKDFYDGVISGTQNTYRDFAAEMRMMGIQEAQFQSTPAYKKVELIKDAEKLRKQHTESNRYRMNTRVTHANGGLRSDDTSTQFYGLATTHPAYQNPVRTTNKYIWHGFSDTTGGSTGSPTASGKYLANGNPLGFTLSTNFINGLNEDGTAFVNDTTGNAGITFNGDSSASRSFMDNYAVHVRRPNDIEIASGKTFSVTFFVNFHQPNNAATGSYFLEAIADNALTVYLDDAQVGIKEYQPFRWEDENTLAYDPHNWDRPQDILLTNITSGFHKLTLEFSNVTDTTQVTNTRTPDYVAGHTDDKLVGVSSNPVAVAARLRPLKSADMNDDYDKSDTTNTVHGDHGSSFFIWDTTKQFNLGTYDESDIEVVNDVLRLIGEPPVKEFHENALAIETYNLIRKTDIELQGRGWFFNTEKDILLGTDIAEINLNDHVATTSSVYKKKYIKVDDTDFNKGGVTDYVLSFKANNYETQLRRLGSDVTYRVLYNTKTREIYDWFPSKGVEGTAIVHKELATCPQKYIEYLTVRVATILTELYPQSGIDIQRLPKMEQELETYFKDIQSDQASYSVFDNYDTASRIGINRNYQLL